MGKIKLFIKEIKLNGSILANKSNLQIETRSVNCKMIPISQVESYIELNDDDFSFMSLSNSKSKNFEKNYQTINECDHKCKICHENTFNNSNPLISLCNCSGSMKYIHLDCLQNYLKHNVEE